MRVKYYPDDDVLIMFATLKRGVAEGLCGKALA